MPVTQTLAASTCSGGFEGLALSTFAARWEGSTSTGRWGRKLPWS